MRARAAAALVAVACAGMGALGVAPAVGKSGLVLARSAAAAGETIPFRGEGWVVCCPAGPFARVRVVFTRGGGRWVAGAARPDWRGNVVGVAGGAPSGPGCRRSDDLHVCAVFMQDATRGLTFRHMEWYFSAMRTAIDQAGRIVVPKALRDAMGLTAGQEVDIELVDGRLEIEPATTEVTLKKRGKGVVAVPDGPMDVLTADQVRRTLERTRR